MLFVRPSRLSDLDALEHMARTARPVLHSLPQSREALEARIALSEDSFKAEVDFPGEEFYLFVLEDSSTGKVLGAASIFASAGYSEPFYAFRNDALVHASRELRVNRKVHALTMSHELTGRSRLAGYYVDPALRWGSAAHLLSRARMMYIATNRKRFTSEIFALLLGVTDDQGGSPFWDAVGRKFFNRDFAYVDEESGGRSRTFIAELMPSYPVYVPLLPASAQRVLGEPGVSALATYEILVEEGFETDRFIDIFDAGPVLTAQIDSSASAKNMGVRSVISRAANLQGDTYLVGHQDTRGEFRCVLADIDASASAPATLAFDAAVVLGVRDDDSVNCAPLHAVLRREFAGEM